MNCQEARRLVEDVLDKRLSGSVKRKLDLHLTHCRDCRRFYEAEQAEHVRWFRAMNDTAAEPPHPLPPDFADRLVASVLAKGAAHTPFFRRFHLPRWLKRAACFALLLSGAAFAATVVVDAVTPKDDNSEEMVGRVDSNAPDSSPLNDALAAPETGGTRFVASSEIPSDENQPTSNNQPENEKGEKEMNIKQKAATALAAATLAATPASATELPWTGGDATLGDGKVTILCDGSGSVTNVTAKPTGGEELRITGSAMTFAAGAKVSLAAASGTFADGSLVFANDVTAEGALTLNRTDGAFPIWSGNRLSGVTYVNAFAANGSKAADWNIHSAYAVPTDAAASTSSNECPHGIYRPIPTNGKTCNRWSGKHTFSARFQLQDVTTGYIQVRMLTGMRTTAGLYLPNTDTWGKTEYRTSTASDARWFWHNSTPVENVTVPYGGDEYDFGICRIIFQNKNAKMGTIGFAGAATMDGAVNVGQGVKMAVMPKSDSTFAAPEFSGYGDVEYARNSTLSYTNKMVHSTITVTNATVTLNTLGAIPYYCTVVVDNGGLLDVSRASGSAMAEMINANNIKLYPTDIEIRTGGKVFSDRSAGATWKFGRKVPFNLLGGTLECNSSAGSVNYVYVSRLLMMDGAELKCNKPYWVANDGDGYWTVGGTGATVNGPVEFLSASSTAIRKSVVNVNDGATLVFANTIACNSGYTMVDFTKTGGGKVECRSTCHPTALTNGMKVEDGTWKLGINNSWLNARALTLDGGAIAGATNTANTVGVLTVGTNGGTIELDPGATLSFANSTNKTWSGMVIVKGFRERAVRFGDSAAALTREQLDMIRAEKTNGKKMHLCLDSNGYLAPLGMMIRIR